MNSIFLRIKLIGYFVIGIFVFIPFYSAYAYCGDGILQEQEQCDDGNFIERDGCDSYCKLEDMTPPTVSSVSIPNGTTEVSTLTNSINVVFSEAIDSKSLYKDVSVRFEYNGVPIDFSFTLGEDKKTLTINIKQDLFSESNHALRLINIRDVFGNIMIEEYISVFTTGKAIDHTAPTVVVNPVGGTYNFSQDVTLTPFVTNYTGSEEFIDKTAKIYYTLNNADISEKSSIYKIALPIRKDTVLRYFAVDSTGNKTPVLTEKYYFDCPEFPNAKKITDNYPDCKILECNIGFILRTNSCVVSLTDLDPNDYKTNAVTAPLFTSDTPMTIISKPAIYVTPEHKGIIPRPIIFKELKRGTVISFEKNTSITDLDGKPFTGYIKNPENLFSKDYPTNFGYIFRSIFQFKSADGSDLQFTPPYKITIPYAENYNPDERVTVFTYDPKTQKYTEYSRGLYTTDLNKKEVTISSYKTGIFFIAQSGTNYNSAVFTDVTATHWAKNYIEELYKKGIVQGRDKGIYAPDENMTRAEFVKVALSSIGENIDPTKAVKNAPFTDVPLFSWYAPYIARAKSLGLVSGRPDGSFGPDEIINRAEAIKILFTAFNFDLTKKSLPDSLEAKQRFIDMDKNGWYYPFADFAIQNGIMTGVPSVNNNFRYFRPAQAITRAEMAKLAIKTMELNEELTK